MPDAELSSTGVVPLLQRSPDHRINIRPVAPGVLAVGANEDHGVPVLDTS